MDRYSYTCQHCGKDYIPNRRGVQKYCSNSCRTRAFVLRNTRTGLNLPSETLETKKKAAPIKIDKMSAAGVGNVLAGVAIMKIGESIFTSDANKPATKNDLKNLEAKISKRYYPVKNLINDGNGNSPYFDTLHCCIVYFK